METTGTVGHREPWNKGKIVGQKAPFKLKDIWALRVRLPMAQLLQAHEIDCGSVKPFLLSNAERVKAHALAMARERSRPFEYLSAKMRKEDTARKLAERDGIDDCCRPGRAAQ